MIRPSDPKSAPSLPSPALDASGTAPVSSRHIWAQASARIAFIAAVFSLLLGAWLISNSLHLYQGPGNGKVRLVEARELLPHKTALRAEPKNEALKQHIRELDQQLRHDYFRREQLANRGGYLLLAGALVFVAALQLTRHLKQAPVPTPCLSARPADPAHSSRLAAVAVTSATAALAGFTLSLVWNTRWTWQNPLISNNQSNALTTTRIPECDAFPDARELAKNWPFFRGADGSNITQLADLPETWDGAKNENVLWKTGVDLPGESSPVIWGSRVFLTGATKKLRELYCFDAITGVLSWKQPVTTPQGERAEAPEVMEDTGYAAPTAATDGRMVFAIFANGDIAGFTVDGKRLWARNLGTPENTYGHATSLTLWQNRVIVVLDQAEAKAGKSKIMALDARTGEAAWTTSRPVASSWVTPILITHQGREQIITSADPFVIAYDPATGKELWRANCMRGDVASSPSFANGLVYVACDQTCIAAIRPDGTGDVTDTHIVWKQQDSGLPDLCSLLCDGPRIYTLVFGKLYAFDALTGKSLWKHDTKALFEASPALVNGRLHLLSTEGVTIIGEGTNDGFKEMGRAALGENTGSSPAFSTGRIHLRGTSNLFCIGTRNGN